MDTLQLTSNSFRSYVLAVHEISSILKIFAESIYYKCTNNMKNINSIYMESKCNNKKKNVHGYDYPYLLLHQIVHCAKLEIKK